MDNSSKQSGYVVLLTVMIVTSVALILAVSIGFSALTGSVIVSNESNSARDYYLAVACFEKAVLKLKGDPSYTGGENYQFSNGSCQVDSAVAGPNDSATFLVSAVGNGFRRGLSIDVADVAGTSTITRWEEITLP